MKKTIIRSTLKTMLVLVCFGIFSFGSLLTTQTDAAESKDDHAPVTNINAISGYNSTDKKPSCFVTLTWTSPTEKAALGSSSLLDTNNINKAFLKISRGSSVLSGAKYLKLTTQKYVDSQVGCQNNTLTYHIMTYMDSGGEETKLTDTTKTIKISGQSYNSSDDSTNYTPRNLKATKVRNTTNNPGCMNIKLTWDKPKSAAGLQGYSFYHGNTKMFDTSDHTLTSVLLVYGASSGGFKDGGVFGVQADFGGSGLSTIDSKATVHVDGPFCSVSTTAPGTTTGPSTSSGTGGTGTPAGGSGTGTGTGAGSGTGTGGSSGGGSSDEPKSQCDTGGFWGTITDPMGKAVQYALCLILESLENTFNRVVEWLESICEISYTDTNKLAIWRVDRAHASLSSSLDQSSDWSQNILKPTWVIKIWDTLRTFINIFLVFMIIFIAICNIFHININQYAVKKALPGLLLGIMLSNFSGLICRGLLDISELLQTWLTRGHLVDLFMASIANISLRVILPLFGIPAITGVMSAFAVILIAIILLAVIIGLLIILFALTIRIGIIYILYAVSPLAFMALGSPMTSSWFKKWWTEYINWAFFPVAMYFILNLVGEMNNVWDWNMVTQAATPRLHIISIILSIGLIWTAALIPWKLKSMFSGAMNILPAEKLMKGGLNLAKDSAMGFADKAAAEKGWVTPWTAVNKYREAGKRDVERARTLQGAQVRKFKDKLWTGRETREVENEWSRYVSTIGKEEMGDYNEEEFQAMEIRIGKPQNKKERAILQYIEMQHRKNRNFNDSMGLVGETWDEYNRSEGTEKEQAGATLARLLNRHGYDINGDNEQKDADGNFLNLESNYSMFKKEIEDADGGINGAEANYNYIRRAYKDDDEKIRMSHASQVSQLSLSIEQDATTHLTKTNPLTGEIDWNRDEKNIENPWEAQQIAAANERAKRDPQGNARTNSYQNHVVQGHAGKILYGEAMPSLEAYIKTQPDSWSAEFYEQTSRLNRKQLDALIHVGDESKRSVLAKVYNDHVVELNKKTDEGELRKAIDQSPLLNKYIEEAANNLGKVPKTKEAAGALVTAGLLDADASGKVTTVNKSVFSEEKVRAIIEEKIRQQKPKDEEKSKAEKPKEEPKAEKTEAAKPETPVIYGPDNRPWRQ